MEPRDWSHGFLPTPDPLTRLPATSFAPWEEMAAQLSKLVLTPQIRPIVENLPPFPVKDLMDDREYERAMTMLAYMASLYLYAPGLPVPDRLPRHLAIGLYQVASYLKRPPILAYASQTLHNWRRINSDGEITVENITLVQNFLGGQDEEWFVGIHVQIEAAAGKGLAALLPAFTAVAQQDDQTLEKCLVRIGETLAGMRQLLARMPERCDPYIYYHRIRPFMFGWKDNPALPNGLIYKGVAEYAGKPQQFRGETGAQSSIIYAFDAALDIQHEHDRMRAYLLEMRDYMPAADRDFIVHLESKSSAREYVKHAGNATLLQAYNFAVEQLRLFRQLHIEYAALYILKPAKQHEVVGTGGTPFTVYLKKHMRETENRLISTESGGK